MNKSEELKEILKSKNASLVVSYENGSIKEYYNNGIKDIINILTEDKNALKNSVIADKVIGKVVASILVQAGVKEIYTEIVSSIAIPVLNKYHVLYTYEKQVDYIENRDKTGMCPMEKKFKNEEDLINIYKEYIKE